MRRLSCVGRKYKSSESRQIWDYEANSANRYNFQILVQICPEPRLYIFNRLSQSVLGLQGQAVFKTKLSFRPHSVDSHTHKKMTLSMADRSSKSNQIKEISHVGNNPEEGRWEKIRKEEQDLRMSMRTVSSKNRSKEKGARKGLSGGYLEEAGDDSGDDAAFDIAAIKAKFKHGARDKKPIYSSDEESDVESKKGKRLQKAKGMDSDSGSNR